MKSRASYWVEILKLNFWFLPAVVSLLLLMMALVIETIESLAPRFATLEFLGESTVEGTRLLLASIATAVMTVVGVLFSVTIVVLQQVSQQYSPRVIDKFIRSRANQVILGFYVGTFGYSIILLRTIGEPGKGAQGPPQLGPLLAIVFALACLALLIFFIHHLARSIKSNIILAEIRNESLSALAGIQSDLGISPAERAGAPADALAHLFVLRSEKYGYLQEMSWWHMAAALKGGRWQGETLVIPGDYIHLEMPLLRVRTAEPLTKKQKSHLAKMFTIDLVRTHTQDGRFGIRQMVDIALKALSPGINDPSTAVEAVNEIGTVLMYYTTHCIRSGQITYTKGCCLWVKEQTYREFIDLCVNEIALAGRNFYLVEQAILTILDQALGRVEDQDRKDVLERKRQEVAFLAGEALGTKMFGNCGGSERN